MGHVSSGAEGRAGGTLGGQRPPLAVGRPFLAPTPRSAPAVTPPPAAPGRVTPPFLPRELSYTPARMPVVPPPVAQPPEGGALTGEGDTARAGSLAAVEAARAAPDVAPRPADAPASAAEEEDAWAWGGETAPPAIGEPAAAITDSPFESAAVRPDLQPAGADWFDHPLGGSDALGAELPPEERAALALESLVVRLRTGTLALDARAAVDSDEAVLASVLAALFARRAR